MTSPRTMGICIAAGVVIGSGGGAALDVIAVVGAVIVVLTSLASAVHRRLSYAEADPSAPEPLDLTEERRQQPVV